MIVITQQHQLQNTINLNNKQTLFLNEDANHVETANRASQADIDGLVTKLQAALIDNQAAISELDAKAQEKGYSSTTK